MEYKKELEKDVTLKSNIFIENRKKINVTGVLEVLSFDEECVLLDTSLNKLEIIGCGLKIGQLDLKNGEINIMGNINECKYLDNKKLKGSKKHKANIVKKMIGRNK